MSKPSPARYRTTNWSGCTAALRKRGSLRTWLDKDMAWLAPPEGKPGRPAVFSDAAIRFCLTIKGDGRPDIRPVDGFCIARTRLGTGNRVRIGAGISP